MSREIDNIQRIIPKTYKIWRSTDSETALSHYEIRESVMSSMQLELLGLDECLRLADLEGASAAERRANRRRVETAFEIMTSLPTAEDLAFMHAGLCQTHLPRSRPRSNSDVWIRQSGRFRLVIQPGVLVSGTQTETRWASPTNETLYCGVPYGPRARLLMIWLQSEGVKGRNIRMDNSMSAWIRSLGLPVTGGASGTIRSIREQTSRIVTSAFSFQWSSTDGDGNSSQHVQNARIVDGMDLWQAAGDTSKWKTTIQISQEFYDHLREHAVPLDQRAIAYLAGKSLGLDLYCFFAHRLHRLKAPLRLSWTNLAAQFGDQGISVYRTAQRIRECLVDVGAVYPEMRVDVEKHGLLLRNSPPPVPRNASVQGARLTLLGGV